MADLRPLATRIAKRYGVPVGIAHGLIQQESGWNPNARNPSGATGLMQIHLPSHPNVSERQARDPRFAMDYGFRLLSNHYRKYGSWKLALAAYNAGPGNVEKYGGVPPFAETRNYVKNILANAGTVKAPKASRTAAPSVAAALPVPPLPSAGAAPDFSQVAMQNLSDIGSGRFDPVAALSNLTSAVAAQPPPDPALSLGPDIQGSIPNFGGLAPRQAAPADGDWRKWVGRPERREGPSAPHTPEILRFVGQVGRVAGQKLTPWGNESHSLTTVSGTPSAHGTGRAADIPAQGEQLIKLGQAALIAAGMSPREARKQKGGLFNIGGHQVIFNTQIGGDHTDHVHVGLRGGK